MSLFEFELTPLEAIESWGTPPDLSLHWFGLSYGTYHIDLGTTRLLEYAGHDGWPQFVEYQIARIHEDVLEMLPAVREPIPSATVRHFVDGGLDRTLRHLRKTWEPLNDADDSLEVAFEALGSRLLDTAYLSPRSGIWIWSFGDKTVIEWDNRDRLFEGTPAWASAHGRHELTRDEFVEEVQGFHVRLMAAMDERVREVCSNWTRPDVKIDFARLAAEQVERRGHFDAAVRRGPRTTDWPTVEFALIRATGGDSA